MFSLTRSPPGPTPAWRVYAEHLRPVQDYGHPLWQSILSNGGRLLPGYVGWVADGGFVPLINTMYRSEEAGDCGVPDGHETLQERFSNRIIKKTSLDTSLPYRQVLLSASVGCDHLSSRRPYPLTVTDDNILNLSLTCESGAGAVLLIDEPGIERQAIINTLFIVRYMREYYDKWLQLAKTTGITPPGEGINFVSQTYSAQARGAVAFAGYPKNAKLEITWDLADDAFEATMNESKVEEDWTIATPDMHCRVRGKHDQVLFIQYYKMKRRLFWLRTIKASAGPHELPGPPNERGAAGVYADYAQRGEPDTLKVVENDELVDQLIDYIFENSTAEYACASTHDVMALLKATSGTRKIKSPASRDDFATLLKLSNQAIVVDDHGVGIFKHNFAEDIENDTESSSVRSEPDNPVQSASVNVSTIRQHGLGSYCQQQSGNSATCACAQSRPHIVEVL